MNLLEKLQLIQTTLHVSKSQRNNFGKYNYRSAEDILEAIKPISKETKTMFKITEELIQIGSYLAIKSIATIYDLETKDFNSISSDAYAILDFDAKGMQNPQRTGSSSSYAKKYALGNLLLIDDTKDSDAINNHSNSVKTPSERLKQCKTQQELKEVFLSLTRTEQTAMLSLKDQLKEVLK